MPGPAELEAYDAVALFVDRVRAFRPDFNLHVSALAVAELCHLLDGLPLAIELAAARVKVLPPAVLRDRLADRLDLLSGGGPDLPVHSRTLRDTLAWSHQLLTPPEQRLFRCLAVFAGGMSLDAVEGVAGDGSAADAVLDLLASLVDNNLVIRLEDTGGEPRFGMLATVHAYARERLAASGDEAASLQRHATYFTGLAEQAADHLVGPEQQRWLGRLDTEYRNLRVALQWLGESEHLVVLLRLAWALWRYWRIRGYYSEGRLWLALAARRAEGVAGLDPLRAQAWTGAGWLSLELGDGVATNAQGAMALEIAHGLGDSPILARALNLMSSVAHQQTDYAPARRLDEEALAVYRRLGDADGIAGTLNNLAITVMDAGQFEEAMTLFIDARHLFEANGNRHGAAHPIDNMSVALACLNRFDEAAALAEEALAIYRSVGDRRGIPVTLDHVGKCATRLGDYPRAWTAHRESLPYRQEADSERSLAVWLAAVAALLAACGDAEQAARALGAADASREATGNPLQGTELIQHRPTAQILHSRLGRGAFDVAYAQGRETPLEHATAAARDAAEGAVTASPQPVPILKNPYGLSARELEVLRLLVGRQSDKQIADQLFISRRTVGRHVSSILAKLGVPSRHKAAVVAGQASWLTSDSPATT